MKNQNYGLATFTRNQIFMQIQEKTQQISSNISCRTNKFTQEPIAQPLKNNFRARRTKKVPKIPKNSYLSIKELATLSQVHFLIEKRVAM